MLILWLKSVTKRSVLTLLVTSRVVGNGLNDMQVDHVVNEANKVGGYWKLMGEIKSKISRPP